MSQNGIFYFKRFMDSDRLYCENYYVTTTVDLKTMLTVSRNVVTSRVTQNSPTIFQLVPGPRPHLQQPAEHLLRGEGIRSRSELGQARSERAQEAHFRADVARAPAVGEPRIPDVLRRDGTPGAGGLPLQGAPAGSDEVPSTAGAA